MGKLMLGRSQPETAHDGPMSNMAERKDHPTLGYGRQFMAKIAIAGGDLGCRRPIFRRQALDRVGDPALSQHQSIMPMPRSSLTAKTMFKQSFIQ
jgi:hypothetical protein